MGLGIDGKLFAFPLAPTVSRCFNGSCEAARCSRKGAAKMLTTTTTRPVKFHGWTLPQGATVTVSKVTREVFSPVEQFCTASCTSDAAPYAIAVPTDALAATYTELATLPWRTDYLY